MRAGWQPTPVELRRQQDMQQRPPEELSELYQTALSCYQAGINVLPIRTDGSKCPALKGWKIYQQRRTTPGEIRQWFYRAAYGLAVVTGDISGGLEALDIDSRETYQAWLERIRDDPVLRPLYERIVAGYLEATPDGGRHLLYRCEGVGRNQTLARRPLASEQGYQTLIETRGNGGMLIIAPSGGRVHPSGRPYRLLSGGVMQIATITPQERSLLLALGRSFDETPARIREERASYVVAPGGFVEGQGTRPGDLFNQSARWEEILCPHGWRLVRQVNGVGQWRRPGKKGPGISATTNYAGNDLLYVFSTATSFEPERGYTKFTAYAILEHAGDFSAAARALVEEGYVR
jgi:putative DNA primase/helicase